jgi:two-component system C4-dicarboxylate transport response regulator DctD
VLQDGEFSRLGGESDVRVDTRIIAATNRNIEEAVAEGSFREDLYYRLNVVSLTVPSLRERREDVPLLFNHLAREARTRYRREIPELDGDLLTALMAHDWPGNVRELRNAADRFVLGMGDVVPGGFGVASGTDSAGQPPLSGPLAERLDAVEKSILEAELRRQGGSLKATYEALGLSRKTLYDKLQRHGIRREDFLVSEEG